MMTTAGRFQTLVIVVLVVIAAELAIIARQGSGQSDVVAETYAVCQQIAALRGDLLIAAGSNLGPVYVAC